MGEFVLFEFRQKSPTHKGVPWGLALICVGAGVFVLGTTVRGIQLHFSPTLFWDQWDGGLEFYMAAINGEWSRWWAPHNEHRLLIPRLIYFADFAWFGGRNIFNFGTIYLSLALLGGLLFRIFCFMPVSGRWTKLAAGGLVVALLGAWTQRENLLWGFQSQFVLVLLFALAAFSLLWYGKQFSRPIYWTLAAGLMASASAICMINGLLCFPILLLMAWWIRVPRFHVVLLGLWGLLLWGAYFYGLHALGTGNTPHVGVMPRVATMAAYTLCYLGAPFVAGFQLTGLGYTVLAGLAGGLLLSLTTILFLKRVRRDDCTPMVVMLAMILFVLA